MAFPIWEVTNVWSQQGSRNDSKHCEIWLNHVATSTHDIKEKRWATSSWCSHENITNSSTSWKDILVCVEHCSWSCAPAVLVLFKCLFVANVAKVFLCAVLSLKLQPWTLYCHFQACLYNKMIGYGGRSLPIPRPTLSYMSRWSREQNLNLIL